MEVLVLRDGHQRRPALFSHPKGNATAAFKTESDLFRYIIANLRECLAINLG